MRHFIARCDEKHHFLHAVVSKSCLFNSSLQFGRYKIHSQYFPIIRNSTSICSNDGYPNPDLVDATNAPSNFCATSALVYDTVVNDHEGNVLLQDLKGLFERRKYQRGHWDSVITKYKEIEVYTPSDSNHNDLSSMIRSPLSEESCKILEKVRKHLQSKHFRGKHNETIGNSLEWLPCHAIDLSKNGTLSAHVDSVKFSGKLVAGLSLLSPCIMRLRPSPEHNNIDEKTMTINNEDSNESTGYIDMYLPPLSLYVLSGISRYEYTHEILPSGALFRDNGRYKETDNGILVERERRVSIIFRDCKQN
mmetsp:Transcript_6451/g.9373  ORF Transcript_6451/g.9373 Transcript_6451/m.9373 type:complete len:306 (-) Transcript_6451:138-1055(-)